MTRAVPICHLTIGPQSPMWMTTDDGKGGTDIEGIDVPRSCLGSRCSMWIAERDTRPSEENGVSEPTGLGLCAANPDAEPWPDPAAEKEPTP